MARQWGTEYPGTLCHVTSRGNDKNDIFRSIKDREIPALRELTGKPDIAKISKAADKAYPEDGKLARAAGIYLCHRFSGARLKEIGDLYGILLSGVTQAARRFEEAMKKDRTLEKRVIEIVGELSLSNCTG